jgi:hypothetical protein
MAIDVPHTGDSIIRRDSVLIADGRLAARRAICGMDFPSGPGGGGGFTLGWRPSSGFGTPTTDRVGHNDARPQRKEFPMSKKGGNKTSKAAPKPPMANKGPKKK